jgi:hypothetical protein
MESSLKIRRSVADEIRCEGRSGMEQEIREQLVTYLAGETSPRDLEAWLLAETWEADDPEEPAASELAYGALLALAEHSREHLEVPELRKRIEWLALSARFGEPVQSVTASSSPTRPVRWALSQFAAAGRQSEAAHA